MLDAFLKSREEPIPDLLKAIRKSAEERQMSKKFTDQVVSGYLAEPEQSRFGVINAFYDQGYLQQRDSYRRS